MFLLDLKTRRSVRMQCPNEETIREEGEKDWMEEEMQSVEVEMLALGSFELNRGNIE